ncbi:MAG: CHASE4 domain-containing protein, partial [Methanobacteriaceae archaeon]|nr:CHASE4 domain-containing protein [Methanobacteriaceae archaeon]
MGEVKIKLRGKTLTIMAVILLSLILSFFVISEIFFMNSASDTENQYANMVIKNSMNSLENDLNALNNTANDWSQYDAAYNFVKTNNSNFKNRSLIDETFSRLNINFIIFTNKSGDIIFSKAVDLRTKKEIPMYHNLKNVTKNYIDVLNQKDSKESSGFIYINERPLMIASKPVLKSDGKGPSPGYMIMGRYLDTYTLDSLPQESKIYITPINSSDNLELLNHHNQTNVGLNTSNDIITGYTTLNGTSGEPSLLVKIEMPRTIYKNSQKTILFLALSILISGLVASFFVYYYLDRNLLRRLDKITSSVLRIGRSNDLSGRVPILGDDELAEQAKSINMMLQSLDESNQELKKSREGYKTIFENTGTAMILVDSKMQILLANTKFQQIFDIKNILDNNYNLKNLMAKKDHPKLEDYQLNLENNIENFKNYEFQLINKNDEVKDFFATFSFFKTSNEVLISLIDITEHK